MKAISEVIISLADLAEAEGRQLKRRTIQTVIVILLIFVAFTFIVLALGLMLIALYNHLSLSFPPVSVWLIEGLLSFTIAGVLIWIAIRVNQRP